MSVRQFFILVLTASTAPFAAADVPEDLRVRVEAATVRVTNEGDNQTGSGVLIAQSKTLTYVLTAQHVVPTAKKVELKVTGGKTFPAEVLARSAESDLAVLRLATVPGVPTPLKLAEASAKPKKVISVGWEKGNAPTALAETLKGKVRLKKPGESNSVSCWEVERKPAAGRSGGPLVDEKGLVIGVASGHDGTTGYYVAIDEVHTFLRQNGLQFLTEED